MNSPDRTGSTSPVPANGDESGGDLPEAAKEEIEHELSRLDPVTRETVRPALVRVARTVMVFAGPLPPPSMLREYGKLIDDGANRIFAMAEKEQTARLKDDERFHRASILGLSFGFIVSLALISGAIVCAIVDQPVIAGLFLGAGAISMVPALIKGRDFFRGRDEE